MSAIERLDILSRGVKGKEENRFRVALGVGAEDDDSEGGGGSSKYNDPNCVNRRENKGIMREAIFSRSPTSSLCGMEWNTLLKAIPGAWTRNRTWLAYRTCLVEIAL